MEDLKEYLEPTTIDDIFGQGHLLKDKSLLRVMSSSGNFESIIFHGPPGSGKSSIAKIIGRDIGFVFYRLHAASSGSSEIKKIVDNSKQKGVQAVIFVDEIHRFSKTQQDLLLDIIDEKYVKLIGASTENPYHSLTQALRSRSIFFKFKPLDSDALRKLISKCLEGIKSIKKINQVIVQPQLEKQLIEYSNGDARRLINFIDSAAELSEIKNNVMILDDSGVREHFVSSSYSADEHYDLLSAMIKSIRGSDPDASLIWCFKLINSGVSHETIFRRLLISASEDIGNAYPDALIFALSACSAFDRVGVPEGNIILANVVTFLASCPKSNRSYDAYKSANSYLKHSNPHPPFHITHNGKGYKYPFDYGDFVIQKYIDDNVQFYFPSDYGFEKKIGERLKRLWGNGKRYE